VRVAVAVLALACACSKPVPRSAAPGRAVPALFAHVPADTPYLLGAFDAIPLSYYGKLERALRPVFFRALRYLSVSDDSGVILNAATAIGEELAGGLTVQNLERIGLSATPRYAFYGLELTTAVFRVEIADDATLLATIDRVAKRAKLPLPARERRAGREFWRITTPPSAPSGTGVSFIVAIADDQLVLAAGRPADVERHLPAILGLEKPRASMADGAVLAQIMERYKVGEHLVGFVDSRRVARAGVKLAGAPVSPACAREIDRLAARVPRLVFGWAVRERETVGTTVLELAPDLAAELAAAQTAVPGLDVVVSDGPLVTFGAGLDLERGRVLGLDAVQTLQRIAGTCGAAPSDALARAEAILGAPFPAPWGGLRGLLIAIHDIAFPPAGGLPTRLDLTLALTGTAPAAVLDLVEQLGVPAIPRDGKLHELAGLPMPFPVQAGVGAHALVVATGPQGAALGAQVLAATPRGRAPLFVVNYDSATWERVQREVDRRKEAEAATDEEAEPPLPEELERQLDEAHGQLYGRMRGTLTVAKPGLTVTWSTELR